MFANADGSRSSRLSSGPPRPSKWAAGCVKLDDTDDPASASEGNVESFARGLSNFDAYVRRLMVRQARDKELSSFHFWTRAWRQIHCCMF